MSSIVLKKLKAFDIHLEYGMAEAIAISDLLDEEKCLLFLQKQMADIKAPNLSVTASMLSKRYAYLVVSSTLYSMVEFNCVLHLPVKACSLSTERKLCIKQDMCKWQEIRSMEREQWRENILYELFSTHITPVLEILKRTSRIPSSILWENIAIRINSIYRKIRAKEFDQIKIDRLNSDFNFLKSAGGDLFNLHENPIKKHLKTEEELRLNPIRKTCCMYYKLGEDLEGIGYCEICPQKTNK
jgi:ferric iron reductase protein FhuF